MTAPQTADDDRPTQLQAFAVPGIPVLTSGDDVVAVIAPLLNSAVAPDGYRGLRGDDIVVVAGKVVAKAQGRWRRALPGEFVSDAGGSGSIASSEVLDEGAHAAVGEPGSGGAGAGRPGFRTAKGIPAGLGLDLPVDVDAAAAEIRRGLAARFGGRPGVVISGSEQAERGGAGVRDVALGSAGLDVHDAEGGSVVDALAALAGLVMASSPNCPVVIVRGVPDVMTWEDGPLPD